jgi:hypothetical protein
LSDLQQAPQGYLGALGLKATGKNPNSVSDELAAVLESGAFYFPPQVRQNLTNFTTPVTDGGTASLTVPDSEAWIVYAAGGSVPLLVGDTLTDNSGLVLTYAQNLQTPTMQLATGPVVPKGAMVVAGSLQVGALFPRPIVFPPKAVLSIRLSGSLTLGANRTAQCNALVYPFTP